MKCCWCVALALTAVSPTSTALSAAEARPVAMRTQLDANGQSPRLLSAFFGLDDSLPPGANRICMGAAGKDGMPVVLSRTVDPETLEPDDFSVFTRSGAESTPLCVTLRPALDAGELRTVLLVGEFGDARSDPPARVLVSGDLLSDGTLGEPLNFRGAETQVTALDAGPTLVWAEIVPEEIWSKPGRGTACPTNTQQVVRATWAGGVRLPGREEPGDAERALYRVTVAHPDGSREEVAPASLADLGDNDNNHLLCLDTTAPATAVAFPAGHLVDPNGDLNPDSQIAVTGAAGTRESRDTAHDEEASTGRSARPARFNEIKLPAASINGDAERAASRKAYFGDLHVHTTYSFDAFASGTRCNAP